VAVVGQRRCCDLGDGLGVGERRPDVGRDRVPSRIPAGRTPG